MPQIQSKHGWKECITHKEGNLRDRVLDRLNCETQENAMWNAHLEAVFKNLRANLYFSLVVCVLGLIFGIYLLTEYQ